jgi:hypothetical protein
VESWQLASLVLVALFVGASVPVLVQISLAARGVHAAVVRASARIEPLLSSLQASATRFEQATSRLDGERIEGLLDAIDSLSHLAVQVRETTRVASALGAAVGPAVGAAVRAWRDSGPENEVGHTEGDGRREVKPEQEVGR